MAKWAHRCRVPASPAGKHGGEQRSQAGGEMAMELGTRGKEMPE